MTHPSSTPNATTWSADKHRIRVELLAMWLCGGSYFVQFLAMAFASFPLQTHLRKLLEPSQASLVAGLIPIATCSTYLLFRVAESKQWTRFPQRSLAIAIVLLAVFQWVLGWKVNGVDAGYWLVGPAFDTGACLLLMGCANASCMILLNHIAIATLNETAYVVRAAGTAGYMVAVVLLGVFWTDNESLEHSHLFVASTVSVIHAVLAWVGVWTLGYPHSDTVGHSAENASVGIVGQKEPQPAKQGSNLTWWGLLLLVWMVAMCEMAYALYSHEFVTKVYGSFGYYLFAAGLALEIALLLLVSRAATLRSRLLFLGPLGWMCLMIGGLLADGGLPSFGALTLAMALNCPFQMSVSEHVHRIDARVLGIASVSLAQSLGYLSAAGLSALVSRVSTGPRNLWLCMIPVATLAMLLSVWKMRRMRSQTDSCAAGPIESD
ncbi:MAG: hypothetical protein ACK57P_03440 [Planctomycetota bacterium]